MDKIKLDEVNTLAKRLISQDHSGSTEIQQSLDKLNARYVCSYVRMYVHNILCIFCARGVICTYLRAFPFLST